MQAVWQDLLAALYSDFQMEPALPLLLSIVYAQRVCHGCCCGAGQPGTHRDLFYFATGIQTAPCLYAARQPRRGGTGQDGDLHLYVLMQKTGLTPFRGHPGFRGLLPLLILF